MGEVYGRSFISLFYKLIPVNKTPKKIVQYGTARPLALEDRIGHAASEMHDVCLYKNASLKFTGK